MCGIVGFLDKTERGGASTGTIVLTMLRALACRGPDGAGVAMLRDDFDQDGIWSIRVAPGLDHVNRGSLADRLAGLGEVVEFLEMPLAGMPNSTFRFRFQPSPGTTVDSIEKALGATAGGLEVLALGQSLDLVKQVGSPDELETSYAVSKWTGRLAIGHTRMSTESRIDLSHSQPFWAHGVPDLATVHNGHVTNYHQLRRRYEQSGSTFYTDNDSEVIGVYLREKLEQGCSLPEALAASIDDLDGAFNYLVASSEGLGIVRDRFGFKPLMVVETEDFVAVATEEIALRRALPGAYRVHEPPPGRVMFYPSRTTEPALS